MGVELLFLYGLYMYSICMYVYAYMYLLLSWNMCLFDWYPVLIHRLLNNAWGAQRARTIRNNARTKWRPLNSYVTGRAVAGIQKVGWWESPIVNRGLHSSSLMQNLGRGEKQKWRRWRVRKKRKRKRKGRKKRQWWVYDVCLRQGQTMEKHQPEEKKLQNNNQKGDDARSQHRVNK